MYKTAEKEVQDTSCRGSGGVPQIKKSPKNGGYRGLIKTISAVSSNMQSMFYIYKSLTCTVWRIRISRQLTVYQDDFKGNVSGVIQIR